MKKLDILFVIDPIEKLNLKNDTSYVIMREVAKRGHRLWITEISDIHLKGSVPFGRLTSLSIESDFSWKKLFSQDARMDSMDTVFMRKDPPMDERYMNCARILSFINQDKTFIINSPLSLLTFNEKLGILLFPEFIPASIVSNNKKDFIKFLKKYKKIAVKPLHSCAGKEVLVLSLGDKNVNALLEILTHEGKRQIMAQEYLNALAGDTRILMLDGKILGAVKRMAHTSDFRNNTPKSVSRRTKLTKHETEICEKIGSELKKMGIVFAGLDMIDGLITEINISSPAMVPKINRLENKNLERLIVDFIEQTVQKLKYA